MTVLIRVKHPIGLDLQPPKKNRVSRLSVKAFNTTNTRNFVFEILTHNLLDTRLSCQVSISSLLISAIKLPGGQTFLTDLLFRQRFRVRRRRSLVWTARYVGYVLPIMKQSSSAEPESSGHHREMIPDSACVDDWCYGPFSNSPHGEDTLRFRQLRFIDSLWLRTERVSDKWHSILVCGKLLRLHGFASNNS